MSQRLKHDVAWALAQNSLEMIGNCLREEEHSDAFAAFYEAALAALIAYDVQKNREQERLLRPSSN